MANSYRDNYIYSGDEFSLFASKVFCSWDYGVTDKSAGLLKHKSVYNELKVCGADHEDEHHKNSVRDRVMFSNIDLRVYEGMSIIIIIIILLYKKKN